MENLPKLDERRAEVVEQHPKPARDRLAPALRERLDGLLAAHLAPQPGALEHVGESVPGCDDADLAKAVEVLERVPNQAGPQLRTPPCHGQTLCLEGRELISFLELTRPVARAPPVFRARGSKRANFASPPSGNRSPQLRLP